MCQKYHVINHLNFQALWTVASLWWMESIFKLISHLKIARRPNREWKMMLSIGFDLRSLSKRPSRLVTVVVVVASQECHSYNKLIFWLTTETLFFSFQTRLRSRADQDSLTGDNKTVSGKILALFLRSRCAQKIAFNETCLDAEYLGIYCVIESDTRISVTLQNSLRTWGKKEKISDKH